MADSLYEGIPGLSDEEQAIARRRKLAEMMLAQGQQPVAPFTQAGRMVAPMHWTQGLAQLAQAYLGGKGVKKAETGMTGLANKRQQMIADALAKYKAQSEGGPVTFQLDSVGDEPPTQLQQQYKADPEGALFEAFGNAALPDATRQAMGMQYQAGLRREDKAEERRFRLVDTRLAREDRERLELRLANIAADSRRDVAAMSQAKPPSGFRFKEDGTLEAIAGGPADLKAKEQRKKEVAAKNIVDKVLDAEIENINKLIGPPGKMQLHPGLNAAVGSVDVRFPTVLQDTADAEAYIESLQSKASINALRDIRAGGSQSIGQITEREWPRLESMKATLQMKQGDAQYPQSLNEYRDELLRMKSDAANALKGADTGTTERTVVRTGTSNGRKVVEYSDGTVEYAD